MNQKSTKDRPKIEQIWTKNEGKMELNGQKNGREMDQS